MQEFMLEQKKKQDQEIHEKTKELSQALSNQQRINSSLSENLSEAKYDLERKKAQVMQLLQENKLKNRNLLEERTKIIHNEKFRYEKEKHYLIEKHKKEISNLTMKIQTQFQKMFNDEVYKQLSLDRKKLDKEYNLKKANFRNLSFRQRREAKNKLLEEYKLNLQAKIAEITDRVRKDLQNKFDINLKKEIVLVKNNLKNKLKEIEKEYFSREKSLKIKEKAVLDKEKEKDLELASEKQKLRSQFLFKLGIKKAELDRELVRLKKYAITKANDKMLKELKFREENIKNYYLREFNKKLKEQKEAQQREMDQRKAELVEELRKKAASFLS